MTNISAQIILRAPDGSSPLESETPPSAQSRPTDETVQNAARELEALGFAVGERGAVSLTVTADQTTFERVFSTTLKQATHSKTGTPYWRAESPPRISEKLRPWVADVVFPIEPEFMP